jgi:O-antigen/teichoic acid export membrane protein
MNIVQRLFKNTFLLYLNFIIVSLSSVFLWAYLARVLGPEDFGKLNFALALVICFGILVDSDIYTLAVKEASIRKKNVQELKSYGNYIITSKTILGGLFYLLLFVFTLFLNKPIQIKYLILLYGLGFLAYNFYFDWIFQALERMEYVVLPYIISNLSYVILVISVIKSQKQLLSVPLLYLFSANIGLIISIIIFIKTFARLKLNFSFTAVKDLIFRLIPVGIAVITLNILYQLPTIILGFIRSNQEVGWYNAANKLVYFLIMLINSFYAALLPITSYAHKQSLETFEKLIHYIVKFMLSIALPLSFGGIILGNQLMHLIYGHKFDQSVVVFQLLILSTIPVYLGYIFVQGLLILNKQRELFIISITMIIICFILSYLFVPFLGITGSALSMLLSAGIGAYLQYLCLNHIVRIKIYDFVTKPLIASLIMWLILNISNFFRVNVILNIFFGAIIYIVMLYLVKGFTKPELEQICTIVLQKDRK